MGPFDSQGVTQKIMGNLINCSQTKINRFLSSNGLKPIEQGSTKNLRYAPTDVRFVLSQLYKGGLPKIEKKIQCFYNFKGGTGKTSVTYQVSSHMALLGYKILVIDCDPQAHLSTSFGVLDDKNFTMYDVIAKDLQIKDTIINVFDGLDCIPSNLSLTRLEMPLNQMPKREERFKIALEKITDEYDFVFLDTNPTISHINRNIITASQRINIVCETQPYSIRGLKHLLEDLLKFYNHMNVNPVEISIIPNKYEGKLSTSQEAMGLLNQCYGEYLIKDFAIRKSEDINISAKNGTPLAFFCKINSNALSDINELLHYIIERSVAPNLLTTIAA